MTASPEIKRLLADLGLTVVDKPPRQPRRTDHHTTAEPTPMLAPGEHPVSRVALYHTQRCRCCGETETYYAGSYIRTSMRRWNTERLIRASMPAADIANLPMEIMEDPAMVEIPACFRCAATALLIDRATATVPCGQQLELFS